MWDLPLFAQEVFHHGHQLKLNAREVCLSCHDGSIATDVVSCAIDCAFGLWSSHPVYRQYPPRRKHSEYAPVSQVEAAGIALTDGQITCVSCHDLTSEKRYHPVMDNDRSRLCLTCHIR
jgi:hypothetical protein